MSLCTKAGLEQCVLTDFDGNYSFSNVNPGTYDVEASYVGLNTQRVTGVVVYSGKANKLDFELSAGVNSMRSWSQNIAYH
ncbi:MAG: carboxypeptidase regulatory-like domain-containing protein [Saprospiraceae bacterium]|nr:carboxypeptidase regulatory-like domain-containing protein [Saprospiraceae bacterium]